MPARNLLFLIVITVSCLLSRVVVEHTRDTRRVGEVIDAVAGQAITGPSREQLVDAAIDGMLRPLGDEAEHIPFPAAPVTADTTPGRVFGGVGVDLTIETADPEDLPRVVATLPGSPARKAGLARGDCILAIDGMPARGCTLAWAVSHLRGVPGSHVTIDLLPAASLDGEHAPAAARGGPRRSVELVRQQIVRELVLGDRRTAEGSWQWRLINQPSIALFRVPCCERGTAENLAAAIDAATSADVTAAHGPLAGAVVDLRGNASGTLAEAVAICDLLLGEGTIVSVEGRAVSGGRRQMIAVHRATASAMLHDIPLAVLVDGLTAGAAEVIAACLQDHGRGRIAGSRTRGEGVERTLIPLRESNSAIRLPTAAYIRPSGSAIHRRLDAGPREGWGVVPDAGLEVTPTGESQARLSRWRLLTDSATLPDAEAAEVSPPSDPVLARAVAALADGT